MMNQISVLNFKSVSILRFLACFDADLIENAKKKINESLMINHTVLYEPTTIKDRADNLFT